MIKAYNYEYVIPWGSFNPDHKDYENIVQNSLSWIKNNISISELKENSLIWFKSNNIEIKELQRAEEWHFQSIGKYHWMLNNNAKLSSRTMTWIDNKVNEIIKIGKQLLIEDDKKLETLTREVSLELQGKALGQELEELILLNVFKENNDLAYDILESANAKPTVLRHVVSFLSTLIDEHNSFTEEEIEEGFVNIEYADSVLTQLISIHHIAKTFSKNEKITRKSNRKTISRKVKASEKVNYKKIDDDLKLVSINPSQIIKATGLLVYNTKTRKVGIYYSKDDTGFGVKGTTIQNYFKEQSIQKTLRKPEIDINRFREASKKRAYIILNDYIKGKSTELNGRLNEHTILIKVW